MLTATERQEILDELEGHARKESLCVEALNAVQRRRGWVSDENLRELAGLLGMSPTELDSVATFYSLIFRRPVGRHVILICDSISCWIMGHRTILDHFRQRLGIGVGETTDDGRFTLLPIACLGACDRAPAMMVDDELYGPLTPETINEILEKYA